MICGFRDKELNIFVNVEIAVSKRKLCTEGCVLNKKIEDNLPGIVRVLGLVANIGETQ